MRLRTISHILLTTLAGWMALHGLIVDATFLLGVALTGEADGLLGERGRLRLPVRHPVLPRPAAPRRRSRAVHSRPTHV